jgi:hypothetical protein
MHEREEHEWYRQTTGDFKCEFHDELCQFGERYCSAAPSGVRWN